MSPKFYSATITLTDKERAYVNKLLENEPKSEDDCFGEDETWTKTVTFSDGNQADIKICGVQFREGESNLPYTEAVLFDPNGYQLVCTEPSDDIMGEWELEYSGVKYKILIR